MTNLQNIELARSIERRRVFCAEHGCSNRTVLQRVTDRISAWSDRRDRS
jgi:hypothetical protein